MARRFLAAGACCVLLILLAWCPATAADDAASKNPALQALEDDLQRTKADLAKAKRDRQDILVEFSQSQLELIKADLREAKRMIAAGEEFNHDTVLQMIKDRVKATDDRLKRERQQFEAESKAAMEAAQAERDAANEAATRQYAAATGQAFDAYHATVAPAELLRKFQTSGGQVGLVIWNLPLDGSLHKRATRLVNIRLLAGNNVVWQRKSLKLERRQPNTEIVLPQVLFDQVVVDVARWSGDGGGLAEIEVFVGGENVALRKPFEVSNTETLPAHLDDQHAVTDGITRPTAVGVGYWIPEERKKASVRINLLGKTLEPEKTDAQPPALNRPRP